MSYCRWSSDDFQSDIYCYESDHGYEIHVAANRVVYAEPLPDPITLQPGFSDDEFTAWWNRQRTVSAIIARSAREPIDLPYGGETFFEDTPTKPPTASPHSPTPATGSRTV